MKYTPNLALRTAAVRLMSDGLVTCAEVSRALQVSRVTANKWAVEAPGRFQARERVIADLFVKASSRPDASGAGVDGYQS